MWSEEQARRAVFDMMQQKVDTTDTDARDALRESFSEAVEHMATTQADVPEQTQERLFGLFHAATVRERRQLQDLKPEQRRAIDAERHHSEADAMRAYIALVEQVDPTFLFDEDEEKPKLMQPSKGAGPSSSSAASESATIFDAARAGDDLARHLSNVQIVDDDGLTALHHAVDAEQKETVAALLAAKADPSALDSQGATPLHYAALLGSDELVQMLLRAGTDPKVEDEDGSNAAALARAEGHMALAELISLARGA